MPYSEARRVDPDAQGDPCALGWLVPPGKRIVAADGATIATLKEPIRYGGSARIWDQFGDWTVPTPRKGERLIADWFAAHEQRVAGAVVGFAQYIRLDDGWFPHEPPLLGTHSDFVLE